MDSRQEKLRKKLESPTEVALYQHIEHTFTSVLEVEYNEFDDDFNEVPRHEVQPSGYVRVSEPVAITFKLRERDDVVHDAVTAIDAQIQAVHIESARKLSDLNTLKQNLLALPNPDRETVVAAEMAL